MFYELIFNFTKDHYNEDLTAFKLDGEYIFNSLEKKINDIDMVQLINVINSICNTNLIVRKTKKRDRKY